MSKNHKNQPPPKSRPKDDNQVEALVTVETQHEFDLLTGHRSNRTFLKMYVQARTSGLLAAISDRDWKTLCTLATYMDADGYCFPSQAELARALGCSRQMANERVKSLAAFRFEGKPVLLIEKHNRSEHGTWGRNGYRVLPISSLSIFDNQGHGERIEPTDEKVGKPVDSTVSSYLDTVPDEETTVSSQTGTVELDTNKNQKENKKHLSKLRKVNTDKNKAERVGSILDRRSVEPSHGDSSPSDRDILTAYMESIAPELRDQAPLRSTVTRLLHIYERAQLEGVETFISVLYQARAITKEHTGSVRGGEPGARRLMPYFIRVVEDLVGLKEDDDLAHNGGP